MKLQELETELSETEQKLSDTSNDTKDKRQRVACIRDEIKSLNTQLDMLSHEQEQLGVALRSNDQDSKHLYARITDLNGLIVEEKLSLQADKIAATLPDFWTSFRKGIEEHQATLDTLIVSPTPPDDIIQAIREKMDNPKGFGGVEYVIRRAEGEYKEAIREYAMAKVRGLKITPALINMAKEVITQTLKHDEVITYWIANEND